MELFGGEEQGVSPVIGVVLMVAITVALAAVVAIVVTSSGDQLNEGSANAKVEFNPSSAGLEMKIEQISTDATVQLNGVAYEEISKDSAGKTILLPTTPGDKITLVSGNSESSVLVTKKVEDRSEIGNFVASYRLNTGSGSTIKDYSNRGNEMTLQNNGGTWMENGINFNGDNHNGARADITGPTNKDVEGMTLAISLKADSFTAGTAQAFEYSGGNTFEVQPNDNGDDTFSMGLIAPSINSVFGTYQKDETHVAVITYTTSTVKFYVNGEEVYSGSSAGGKIGFDRILFGYDDCGCHDDRYDGKIYEFRQYYEALDDSTVKSISEGMDRD